METNTTPPRALVLAMIELRRDCSATIGNLSGVIRQAEPAYKEPIVGATIQHACGVISEIRIAMDRDRDAMKEAIRRAALAETMLKAAMRS